MSSLLTAPFIYTSHKPWTPLIFHMFSGYISMNMLWFKKFWVPSLRLGLRFGLWPRLTHEYMQITPYLPKKHQYLKKKPKNLPHANSPRCTKKTQFKIKQKNIFKKIWFNPCHLCWLRHLSIHHTSPGLPWSFTCFLATLAWIWYDLANFGFHLCGWGYVLGFGPGLRTNICK